MRAAALLGLLSLLCAQARAQTDTSPQRAHGFVVPALNLRMVWIEPGVFLLGSPDDEGSRGVDEGPQTRVTLTSGFWIGSTEVTQAQWQIIMQTNPSRFMGASLPVEQVSWTQAMEFSRRVTKRERAAGRLPDGYAYTLPTEAQWEYAAKAGATGAFAQNVDDFAWHDQNSAHGTHPVATRKPNAWGLHDTLGNVWEWCADWYGSYPGGDVRDYAGPTSGTARANRGGSWWAGPRGARPANRYRDMPQNANDDVGFRLALTPVRAAAMPAHRPGAALTGELALAGTDSMAPLLRRWIALFRTQQPGVQFHVQAGAPPIAAAALVSEAALLGFTGRTLFDEEVSAITRARRHPPQSIRVAAGAFADESRTHTMAVFVHADNPLRQLSLAQIRQIYSGKGEQVTWRALGVTAGEWADRPVRALVAKLGTGATNFVREAALGATAWSPGVQEFPTDAAAIAALAADRDAICIGGLPYGTASVRALALSAGQSGLYFEPTFEHVLSRRYPLARLLYFHAVVPPGESLAPLAKEFVRLVLSEAGQKIALESGYLPLTAALVNDELQALE